MSNSSRTWRTSFLLRVSTRNTARLPGCVGKKWLAESSSCRENLLAMWEPPFRQSSVEACCRCRDPGKGSDAPRSEQCSPLLPTLDPLDSTQCHYSRPVSPRQYHLGACLSEESAEWRKV